MEQLGSATLIDGQNLIMEVEHLTKRYQLTQRASENQHTDDFCALNDVSFRLKKGDTLGVIGVNGSGKSTLLKIIGGITKPTAGLVSYAGTLASILDIGSGFYPDLSGRENAYLALQIFGAADKKKINDTIDNIIVFAELSQFIDQPVKNYSSGMYLRLALAVALYAKVDILVLDEIFSVGDSAFMVKSREKVKEIIKQSHSVILASHNMNDILMLCNKCVWLQQGTVKMFGAAPEVVASYLNNVEQNISRTLVASVEWEPAQAPTYESSLRLNKIAVQNEKQADVGADINYNNSIVVDISYDVLADESIFGFSVVIDDLHGTPVFSVPQYLTQFNSPPVPLSAGRYLSSCKIAEKVLNTGTYTVSIRVLKDNFSKILFLKDVLCFKVTSPFDEQREILSKTPTNIVPTFPWSTTRLSLR